MKTTEEMLNYLKALNDEEVVYFLGDGGHPMAGGRLMSVASDGMRDYGSLGYSGVEKVSLSNEAYELIKKQDDNNEISLEELWGLGIYELLNFIAYKKGCLPCEVYYCAYHEWSYDSYRDDEYKLEWLIDEINFFNTYEEALQDLGALCEDGYLNEWANLSGDQIQKCYNIVIEYKKLFPNNI